MSERTVGRTFNRLFQGCKQRIIVTTFASNVHRIQQIMDAAAECGRKVAVTGRSMENVTKVAMDLGYMKPPKNTVIDINKIKSMPLEKQVIVTTGSQGEEMTALYRMAFSQHKQIEVGPGDRVIISASAIPGNENTVSRVINELFRKGVEVIYDRADMLHVSGHACQEELKIIHALTKPKYFIPVHGEQRMLQLHKDLASPDGHGPQEYCHLRQRRRRRDRRALDEAACPVMRPRARCLSTATASATSARSCCATASIWRKTAWSSSCCPSPRTNGDLLAEPGDHHARLYLRQGFRGAAAGPQKPHDVHGGGLPRQARARPERTQGRDPQRGEQLSF